MCKTAKFLDSYRPHSEDRAAILHIAPDTVVLLVADGVGGQPNGGDAAEYAVMLAEQFIREHPSELTAPHFWTQLLATIDSELCNMSDIGETTLTAVCLTPSCLVGASVGDSEAWWIGADGAVQVLTEGHGRKPFLGRGSAFPFGFALFSPNSGALLVATDGLFKYTSGERIARIVRENVSDLPQAGNRLRDAVRSPRGNLPDDLAILLAQT